MDAVGSVEAARGFLCRYAKDRIEFRVLSGAGHSIATVDHGGSCGSTGGSYLDACGFDAAVRLPEHLDPPAFADSDASGELFSFDQAEFTTGTNQEFVQPEGCRHGWGYSGADYAVRSGVQIRAIAAMIERLERPIGR
jgi:hypothetical protein